MFKLGKVKVPHRKHTSDMEAVRICAPASVLIPMAQHIGAPAIPSVKVGDKVYVGTKIADADGFVSAPIHSSVSGIVKKIEPFLTHNGKSVSAILIESDGEMANDPSITRPTVNSIDDLCVAIRESGLVGLGGAGFPTAVKLEAEKKGLIKKIIINGAECEPYITADTRTMIDDAEYVVKGVEILEKYISADEIVIGIEKNKSKGIAKLRQLFENDAKVRIVSLPATYPQGAEKVLVYNTIGRVIPEGGLPSDVGCLVMNITTVAFIAHYLETGMPLVEKRVTVDGSAIKNPKNLIVPIGTPIKDVLDFVEADMDNIGKVLHGGPMMGVSIYNINDPILKNSNAITAISVKDAVPAKQYACIHCGKCVSACPLGLNPTLYAKAMQVDDKDDRAQRLINAKLTICMECGCCSYVCPSHRPLVETNRLAKADLKNYQSAKKD